jgi:hypothetical protein
MFVQVIQGRVTDVEAIRRAMDRWITDLAPGATGWLGSTAGATDDGRFVATARFTNEAAARANSDRPEQGAWWAETENALAGATFHDCSDVTLVNGGGSDRAGFVQVMHTHSGQNVDRLRELGDEISPRMAELRPDLMGFTIALHDDGGSTQIAYFSSEKAAREGEQTPPPAELAAQLEEMGRLMGEVEYFDLREPWLFSA